MTYRFIPDKQIRNARVARPVSARVIAWFLIIAAAGAIISAGFIISARQHFQAVALGYNSEDLRRQASRLEEKVRQLELELARESSPVQIERRAQKIGLERANSKPTGIRRPTGR
jgi:cell division protein FtsL